MTTPAKWKKLHNAADLYTEFHMVTMRLCRQIKMLHGGLKFDNEEGNEEYKDIALQVSKLIEDAFHQHLDPYVIRLEEIDKSIKDNLPKPPGSIILPDDAN
jgi:ATP-dependent Clp protease ATP-binding subunit ClpA